MKNETNMHEMVTETAVCYETCTSLRGIAEYLKGKTVVAFDFETSPKAGHKENEKAALDPHCGEITGISLSVLPSDQKFGAIYIPLGHHDGPGQGANAPAEAVLKFLKKALFENPDCLKIAHNLGFEAKFLLALGIRLRLPVYDTMAGAQLMLKDDTHFRRLGDSGLKQLVAAIFKIKLVGYQEIVGAGSFADLDPRDRNTCGYACADAYFALKLWVFEQAWLAKNIPSHLQLAETMESPVALFTGMMEYHGFLADQALLKADLATAAAGLTKLRRKLEGSGQRLVQIGANAVYQPEPQLSEPPGRGIPWHLHPQPADGQAGTDPGGVGLQPDRAAHRGLADPG